MRREELPDELGDELAVVRAEGGVPVVALSPLSLAKPDAVR
jgi:hypothetical protein